jgi:hypothetical protein
MCALSLSLSLSLSLFLFFYTVIVRFGNNQTVCPPPYQDVALGRAIHRMAFSRESATHRVRCHRRQTEAGEAVEGGRGR